MQVIYFEHRQIGLYKRLDTIKNDCVRSFAFRQDGLLYFRKNAYDFTVVSVDDIICII